MEARRTSGESRQVRPFFCARFCFGSSGGESKDSPVQLPLVPGLPTRLTAATFGSVDGSSSTAPTEPNMSITSFSPSMIPSLARKAIGCATSNVYAITPVTAPIAFDLKTGEFTGISACKAMALKELCPSLSLDAEMNRAALWLLCNPTRRPDGALALFTFLVKRLTAAQARHDRGVVAHASH